MFYRTRRICAVMNFDPTGMQPVRVCGGVGAGSCVCRALASLREGSPGRRTVSAAPRCRPQGSPHSGPSRVLAPSQRRPLSAASKLSHRIEALSSRHIARSPVQARLRKMRVQGASDQPLGPSHSMDFRTRAISTGFSFASNLNDTPPSSDELIPVFADYIDYHRVAQQIARMRNTPSRNHRVSCGFGRIWDRR